MAEKKLKSNLYFLAVSLIVMLYTIFVVGPFADENNAFSEGVYMSSEGRITLFVMSAPLLFIYFLYTLKMYKNLKYFNFLNYPLKTLNICFLFVFSFLSVAGYGFYFILLVLPVLGAIIYAGIMMFFSINKDIQSWKEYIEDKKR